MAACLAIALGAWLDAQGNNLTRPPQLMLSQALLAYGTMLFIGPALAYGFLRMLERGPGHLVTFIVLFSTARRIIGAASRARPVARQLSGGRRAGPRPGPVRARACPRIPPSPHRLAAPGRFAGLQPGSPARRPMSWRSTTCSALWRSWRCSPSPTWLGYIRVFNIVRQRRAAQKGCQMTDAASRARARAAGSAPADPGTAPALATGPPPAPGPNCGHRQFLTLGVMLAVLVPAWGLPPFGGGEAATENAYVRGRTTRHRPPGQRLRDRGGGARLRDGAARPSSLPASDQRIYAARVAPGPRQPEQPESPTRQ